MTPSVAGASFASLGKTVTGWTSNLLATALVVLIALTFGSQLVTLWEPLDSNSVSTESVINQSWPRLQACSLEFGDLPVQLTREAFSGVESEVLLFLQSRCRAALERGANRQVKLANVKRT